MRPIEILALAFCFAFGAARATFEQKETAAQKAVDKLLEKILSGDPFQRDQDLFRYVIGERLARQRLRFAQEMPNGEAKSAKIAEIELELEKYRVLEPIMGITETVTASPKRPRREEVNRALDRIDAHENPSPQKIARRFKGETTVIDYKLDAFVASKRITDAQIEMDRAERAMIVAQLKYEAALKDLDRNGIEKRLAEVVEEDRKAGKTERQLGLLQADVRHALNEDDARAGR